MLAQRRRFRRNDGWSNEPPTDVSLARVGDESRGRMRNSVPKVEHPCYQVVELEGRQPCGASIQWLYAGKETAFAVGERIDWLFAIKQTLQTCVSQLISQCNVVVQLRIRQKPCVSMQVLKQLATDNLGVRAKSCYAVDALATKVVEDPTVVNVPEFARLYVSHGALSTVLEKHDGLTPERCHPIDCRECLVLYNGFEIDEQLTAHRGEIPLFS